MNGKVTSHSISRFTQPISHELERMSVAAPSRIKQTGRYVVNLMKVNLFLFFSLSNLDR